MSNTKWAMVIDVQKCIGCHACSAACRIENQVSQEGNRAWVTTKEFGTFPDIHMLKLPQLCNHCDTTPCVDVCPVQATYKNEDGIVVIDKDKCIGCYQCVNACPYQARFKVTETRKVDKCNFCQHRIKNGLLPACISTCTSQARYFGDLNDPNSIVSKLLKEHAAEGLLPELKLGTNVYYIGIENFRQS